jgi:hypothetical protein
MIFALSFPAGARQIASAQLSGAQEGAGQQKPSGHQPQPQKTPQPARPNEPTSGQSTAPAANPSTNPPGNALTATPAASDKSTGASEQAPTPAVKAAPMTTAEVQSLLQKVYMAAFRVNDLLGILQPETWKIDDAERKAFNQNLDSLRQQLNALEQWRSQFAGQPQNTELGEKTAAAIDAVNAGVDAVSRAVGRYDTPAKSADYQRAAADFRPLQQKLESYIASLRAAAAQPAESTATSNQQPSKPGEASAALQTERIEAPAAAPPPATTTENPESLMRVYQAKLLLHKLYVATVRLNDLLGLVHTERWKQPHALRDAVKQRLDALRNRITSLDALRKQFEDEPDDAYLGFQTYVAIVPVIEDLRNVIPDVVQFESPAAGADFTQPAQWLGETQHDLQPYLNFILQNREQAIHGYQADLAACQNTLNYALRPKAAAPMPNIMPILKGVRHVRRVSKTSEDVSKAKKKAGRARASG